MRLLILGALAVAASWRPAYAQPGSWTDPSPHEVRTVSVEPGVHLEVLAWGGSGEPMVFLAGLGNTAHAFDEFAPRFRDVHRVYGLTRRGFGASSHPTGGYDAATRAHDVVTILDSLGIERAILVGHSIAGDELSKIAAEYPERVRALVYLDAFSYGRDSRPVEAAPWPPQAVVPMTAADSASVESVTAYTAGLHGIAFPEAEIRAGSTFGPSGRLKVLWSSNAAAKVIDGTVRAEYTRIDAPALAVYATDRTLEDVFPNLARFDDQNRATAEAFVVTLHSWQRQQIERFRREVRRGTAIEIPGGHHYVHYSHADEVELAIRSFLDPLLAATPSER